MTNDGLSGRRMGASEPRAGAGGRSMRRRTSRAALACATLLLAAGASILAVPEVASAAGAVYTTKLSLPTPILRLKSVSCTSATACIAVGSGTGVSVIVETANGGATWTRRAVPFGAAGQPTAISCPLSTVCYVASGQGAASVLESTDGGSTWTPLTLGAIAGSLRGLADIACTSATACVAVGTSSTGTLAAISTTNGGTSWTSATVPTTSGTLAGVSCPSATDCVAVGFTLTATGTGGTYTSSGDILATTDGGAIWTAQTVPTGATYLDSVSCPSATDCVATGSHVVTTSDGGSTWTAQTVPTGFFGTGVACETTSHCLVVGQATSSTQAVLATTDGGSTWSAQTVPSVTGELYGISCVGTTHCVAVGYETTAHAGNVIATTDGGSTWAAEDLTSAGVGGLRAISCTSATRCMAVGGYENGWIEITSNGGSSWTPVSAPASTAGLQSVSCPSRTDCFAAPFVRGSSAIDATTNGGSTWTVQSIPSQNDSIAAITCPTTSHCLAVGSTTATKQLVLATTDDGTSWTAQTIPAATGTLESVSCPSTTRCVAVGWTGTNASRSATVLLTTDGGSSWSGKTAPSGVGFLNGVSCPSTTDCVAVGPGTPEVIVSSNGGQKWSAESAPPLNDPTAISCATASDCTAVAGTHATNRVGPGTTAVMTTTDGGVKWTEASLPSGVGSLDGVSCPTATTCFLAGSATGTKNGALVLEGTSVVSPPPSSGGGGGGGSSSSSPTPPAPQPGETTTTSGSSTTSSGTLTVTDRAVGLQATATGAGALTVGSYSGDPTTTTLSTATGKYLDVEVATGSSFTSLKLTVCSVGTGGSLDWWNGTAWIPFSTATLGSTGCIVATVTSATSPDLAQLTGTPVAVVRTLTRVYGQTADATAAAELERAFPHTSTATCAGGSEHAVVLARDSGYQDALSSQDLAQHLSTGTLLTPTDSLSAVTLTALRDEGAQHVYVVGGPLAVSTAVADQLERTPAYDCGGTTLAKNATGAQIDLTVTRVYGSSAYGTAEAVAKAVSSAPSLTLAGAYSTTNATGGTGRFNDTAGHGSTAPSGALPTAILATGTTWMDAESASALSYQEGIPILLTTPTSLPSTTLAALEALGVKQVIVMGGPLAVSDAVVHQLETTLGLSVLRIAGKDYTGTSTELATFELSPAGTGMGWKPASTSLLVARGNGFTDGLAGAVLERVGATGQTPLVLTESPTVLGSSLTAFVKAGGATGAGIGATHVKVTALTVLGGPLAVSTALVAQMRTDLAH